MKEIFSIIRHGLKEHIFNGHIKGEGSELDVYISLHLHADLNTGICWKISAPFIARFLGGDVRKVQRSLRSLEKNGYIKRFAHRGQITYYPILIHKFKTPNHLIINAHKTMNLNELYFDVDVKWILNGSQSDFIKILNGSQVVPIQQINNIQVKELKKNNKQGEDCLIKSNPDKKNNKIAVIIESAGTKQEIPWSFWQRLVNKFNQEKAARILYRAKSAGAKNMIAYISKGLNGADKYIHNACRDEDNKSRQVKAWIEKVLKMIYPSLKENE